MPRSRKCHSTSKSATDGRSKSASRSQVAPAGPTRNRRGLFVAGGALVVLFVLAIVLLRRTGNVWSGPLAGSASDFNVVLITLDTTRADCLGCYGHPLIRTPHIDALAREGVLFEQCTTTAPMTLPSHASIMTSTYPFVHRARMNGRYLVDEGNVTLAETLRDAGYATGAEVAAYVLDAVWGIDQGFDHYRSETSPDARGERFERLSRLESEPADAVCSRAIEWLQESASGKFFLWVHFFDPHDPCTPPPRFRSQYKDPYLGEIAFVDEQIGRLMAEIRRMDLDSRTIVVLTADHGESRFEHNEPTHGYFVYDSTMRVPLIFRCPSRLEGNRRIAGQVRIVDIAPTLLDLLGLESTATVQGESLVPLLSGMAQDLGLGAYGEAVNAHDSFGYARLRTYREGGWKYIHAPTPELYHVAVDPGEKVNLADREPRRLARMRGQLEELIAQAEASRTVENPPSVLDAAAAEKLAALGYIGGFAPLDSDRSEVDLLANHEGPDPKDHIKSYNDHLNSQALVGAELYDQAAPILADLVQREPDAPAYRESYAYVLRKLRRLEEAVVEYDALLRLQPTNAAAHYRLGSVYGELNRIDKSITHLELAVAAMPDYPEAHAYLALAYATQERFDLAEEHFKTSLRLDPGGQDARMEYASLLHRLGRFREAIDQLREGVQHRKETPALQNNLAWYLATIPDSELRDGNLAVQMAEAVVAALGDSDPGLLDTLAAAYAEAGRFDDAIRTASRAVELARSASQPELADDVQGRLSLYESGQPFREQPED